MEVQCSWVYKRYRNFSVTVVNYYFNDYEQLLLLLSVTSKIPKKKANQSTPIKSEISVRYKIHEKIEINAT